ncbi:flagellar biosynthesis repressor FlbT [Rhizosaccharibacter radicis]|uniref:Flagellar biosynthesis repressor FlbT n=1 Tax=Rhizosaccharibacter radicis TaxID=2782605 RepID=A0ABT1VSA6_9PROT|nr:flagellar biosynthesis repressor FlbT [Acetobacteraceae bacterium KSS12]
MSHLVLELRQGDTMIVNGATMRFRNRCRVELVSQARFLFGKQVMQPEDATGLEQELYHALQTAYAGAPEEREHAGHQARTLLTQVGQKRTADRTGIDLVSNAFEAGDFYKALKALKNYMIKEESSNRTANSVHVEGALTSS